MRERRLAAILALVVTLPVVAQQNCPLPPAIRPVGQDVNIFSDQREVDLGDAMAESVAQRVKIIDDDTLNGYLRSLGNRLVQHLPPTQMKFRFYLIELPEVNALSIAGGRVYVSRKMVALAQSDDELAGVLAHELGHIVTHQTAIFTTRRFREVLGVTQVEDRADVFAKFHQYLENEARKPSRSGGFEEGKEQFAADQVALYAMARAGYAPHAYVDLWDRFQQTHGKTGSWFSDLLGSTKPSERRLREMLKNLAALPPGCADTPPGSRTADFAKWQAQVVNYSEAGRKESLPGLVFKQTLALPLRPDITHLRFSSDGKYILAQDEGGIHVLTREPLAVLFYIPALDARDASFSPDSRSVVFYNPSLRVEKWSIPDQKRTSAYELTLLWHCLQTALSPDGAVLACLNDEYELSLVDVASSTVSFSRKNFHQPTLVDLLRLFLLLLEEFEGGNPSIIRMGFSPDGRYFLAGDPASSSHLVWDLSSRHEAAVGGSIKGALVGSFAFVGTDRIVAVNPSSPGKSPMLRFPSGERLGEFPFSSITQLEPAAHGDYLLARPMKDYAAGAIDLDAKKIVAAVKQGPLDIYDGAVISEQINSELTLDMATTKNHLASLRLPQARLGPLRAAAVSPDFDWMAISNHTRGAVWDVVHNVRTTYLRSFQGAWFGEDQSLYADFPKFQQKERTIARVFILRGTGEDGYKIGDVQATQYGPYLLVKKPKKKNQFRDLSDADVEVRDVRDGKLVWTHHFAHEVPSFSFGPGTALLKWPLSESGGRDELRRFPELKDHGDKEDYFCELVDMRKDGPVGKLIVKTNKGSFQVNGAFVAGDWVVVAASGNQVLTYSLASGEQKGHFFGANPVVSSANGNLAVESEKGQLNVYDLVTSELRRKYVFLDPISMKQFSPDGKHLFVLTAGQTAYILDTTVPN